jgi:hypothetical protein
MDLGINKGDHFIHYSGIFLARTPASDSVGPGLILGLQAICSDS